MRYQVACGKSHTLPYAIKITVELMRGCSMNHKSVLFDMMIKPCGVRTGSSYPFMQPQKLVSVCGFCSVS